METRSWDVVGQQRVGPVGVILAERVNVARRAQIDWTCPNHRELGTSPLLQDGQRYLLHVGATTLLAGWPEVAIPRVTTDLTSQNNHLVAA